jgi:hypothetical protein
MEYPQSEFALSYTCAHVLDKTDKKVVCKYVQVEEGEKKQLIKSNAYLRQVLTYWLALCIEATRMYLLSSGSDF